MELVTKTTTFVLSFSVTGTTIVALSKRQEPCGYSDIEYRFLIDDILVRELMNIVNDPLY